MTIDLPRYTLLRRAFCVAVLLSIAFFQSCDKEDPQPVHEPEVITTVEVTLLPEGEGDAVILKFFDADGELGSTAPVITVSGPLKAATNYSAAIELRNETVNPPQRITNEVADEANDHLFCFDVTGDIGVTYLDHDGNGKPIGLFTTWEVGAAGSAQVTISLRHQAGTKTGECPGGGETDVQVTFDLDIN